MLILRGTSGWRNFGILCSYAQSIHTAPRRLVLGQHTYTTPVVWVKGPKQIENSVPFFSFPVLFFFFFFLMVHIRHWGQRSYVKMTTRGMATLRMGSSVGKQQNKTLLSGMKPTRQRHHATPCSVGAVAEDEHQGANAHKKIIQGWNYLKVTFAFSYFFIALFCVGDANVIQSNLSTLLMLWSLELFLWMEGGKDCVREWLH